MSRRIVFVIVFAVAHTIATVVAGMLAMGAVMAGFDDSTAAASPAVIHFWGSLSSLLFFPLVTLSVATKSSWTGLWGYALFLANGALWAYALMGVIRLVGGSRGNRTSRR